MAVHVLKDMCQQYGVCQRPIALRRTNLETGQTELIDIPCGATRDDKCPPCAARARRLRQVQIREGWHRDSEPLPTPIATDDQRALIRLRAHFEFGRDEAIRAAQWDQVADLDQAITEVEELITAEGLRGRVAPAHARPGETARPVRKRSTRRRQDAPALPRQKVTRTTVGTLYTAPDGATYRPSMWLTLTLDSYGPVHSDPQGRPCSCGQRHSPDDPILGTPLRFDDYDYRRAAWDAVHFPRLLDRFWQNLRRCVGWNVQYAGSVEPQRRLAPHAHFAIRGTISRAVLRQVATATYHQVWWPAADQPVYTTDTPPVWDNDANAWVDPHTRAPLPTWEEALDNIDTDPDASPAHVVRFGTQIRAEGVTAGTQHANRTIGYITKYITKSAADCHTSDHDRQRAHLDRLWHALQLTPCSDRCANWLLYGIQPRKADARLHPGRCRGKVHQKATLGIGGRRILISRDWSGKTLADHKADTRAWVRALLGTTDTDTDTPPDGDHPPTAVIVGPVPYAWELARPDDPDVSPLQHRLLRALSQRIQWRQALNAAKDRAAQELSNISVSPIPDTPLEEKSCPAT